MFKSRNFIIGLGMGLIISSLIIFFSTEPYNSANYNLESQLSTQQLKQLAEDRNLHVYTSHDIDTLKEQLKKDILLDVNEQKNVVEKVFYFAIPDGMVSSQVATYLSDINVIQDKTAFINLLAERNLTKSIIAGTYTFEEDTSMDELIDLITDKKK